jgi:hypothetical protein
MAAIAPLCLGMSLTAIFVAVGVSGALLVGVWRERRRATWLAYLGYNAAIAAAVAVLYFAFLRELHTQVGAEVGRLNWSAAFPPVGEPWKLLPWLLTTHAGHMLAYPVGGARGGSSLTAVLCLVAVVVLWRRRRGEILALCLLPLALGLAAAAMHKYPYGQSARTMQYAAPAACLLAGLGWATALAWWRRPLLIARFGVIAIVALGGLGLAELARDLLHPYKTKADENHRQFARWFWSAPAQEAVTLCATTDLSLDLRVNAARFRPAPEYRCYQRMFRGPRRVAVGEERLAGPNSVRVVVNHAEGDELDDAGVQRWIAQFQAERELNLQRVTQFRVNAGQGEVYGRVFHVYHFAPPDERSRSDRSPVVFP